METVAVVVGGLVVGTLVLMGLMQAFIAHKARAAVGREVADLPAGRSLLYFMSPTCGACRAMTPVMRDLEAKGSAVRIVDVSQDPSLAMSLGVMGTPTVMVMEDGRVSDVLVGMQPPARLVELVGG